LQGRGYVLKGPVGEGMLGYDPNLQPAQVYDLNKAKQLMVEAGYPNGLDVELFSSNGRYLKDKELAEAIAAMLGQIGIRAKVTTPEWGKIWPDIQAGRVPFYFFGRGSVRDPSEYLHQYFRTGVTKRIAFSDPELDAALLAEQREMDPAKRLTALRQAMSQINEKAPAGFVLTYQDTFGVSNKVNLKARGDEYIFAWDVTMR
jgi:peptide/nickel transport system substrate-binding protein